MIPTIYLNIRFFHMYVLHTSEQRTCCRSYNGGVNAKSIQWCNLEELSLCSICVLFSSILRVDSCVVFFYFLEKKTHLTWQTNIHTGLSAEAIKHFFIRHHRLYLEKWEHTTVSWSATNRRRRRRNIHITHKHTDLRM